jgi:hypothetical protein
MAPEEVVVDEFEQGEAPVVEDTATTLTSGLVIMTTVLLFAAILVTMAALKAHFQKGMFA